MIFGLFRSDKYKEDAIITLLDGVRFEIEELRGSNETLHKDLAKIRQEFARLYKKEREGKK